MGTDGGECWFEAARLERVRHVHGVYADPYSTGIWVATGDEDEESALWVTTDSFKTLERVAGGCQQLRAVGLLFTREHVYFGSDTEREPNFLWRLEKATGRRERLQAVEGSVLAGGYAGSVLCFTTACEPSVVNTSPYAVVWWSSDGDAWQRLAAFNKDGWPMRLFQYGQVMLPDGPGLEPYLWVTPFATESDQTSIRFDLQQ
jgi:hypothetical protein